MYSFEKALWLEGRHLVCGIDEAGRGPLVGGVYAAAVSAPLELAERLLVGEWSAINDSKQLSGKKREVLAKVIKNTPGDLFGEPPGDRQAEYSRCNSSRDAPSGGRAEVQSRC